MNEIVIFILSILVLIKSSNLIVNSATKLAKLIGVSDLVIGLTAISVGTSLPELASSIIASLSGNSNLVTGNIIGSNIANIGLILGMSATIAVLQIHKGIFHKEGRILFLTTALFILFSLNKFLSFYEGVFLIILFVYYITYLFRVEKDKEYQSYEKYIAYNFIKLVRPRTYVNYFNNKLKKDNKITKTKQNKILGISKDVYFAQLFKNILIFIIGSFGLYVGADFLIPSAIAIADNFGVPQTIVGMFMIAVGTSIPELIVSITALRKGLADILIGNIIGSNITNILMVGGISAVINPMPLAASTLYYFMPVMFLFTLLLLNFIKSSWFLRPAEGFIFLVMYLIFVVLSVLLGF